MKLFSIVGARPQFIKVAALHRAIKKKQELQHVILHTGQHYDFNLSEIFFKELEISRPSFNLNVDDLSLASSIKHMQKRIERILASEKPDIVIVFGDTNSTLAGALAAKENRLTLAHVEAGLRSYNNLMPEEINRIETDKISDFLFCPTNQAMNNLREEKLKANNKIIFSGDIMLDAYNYYSKKTDVFIDSNKIISKRPFILCTLHRQALVESREKLTEVIKALNEINSKVPVILPAHPRFRHVINELDLQINFTISEPVGYLNMISLLNNCTLVITDSGGLQKEAFFSRKICLTLRNETEWTELTDAGVNFLAGDSSYKIILDGFGKAISTKGNFEGKFYGDGNAAGIIVEELIQQFFLS